ncbi:hypothetical protein X471_00636 [Bartonella bacilliformis str. Heidi Mejia]|uniref:Uncharacterized protein n=2 Tax=Bartonella bacilliformis TaxID=774 RepID=A1URT8_BARBK|nr:hypothetical protein [Bartonella bacilliformis]ABM45632.1 conserved hypothetical protein [Bartonella bacilliformis KC583]AMG85536.1 hypothetical protein AL467_01825 [Bartonella bacilliformis]EKS44944.1 hypothetical protein BbINS_01729 [Bartonella bacilliformis INS]EYS90174.1 hypothetical protein X472_00630 [Bartonella bacilliformis San Pedro600-02]EYS92338.1 hypothetical protein X471_00636 [Bartonella bacilliformis str. Heidi Mejia]
MVNFHDKYQYNYKYWLTCIVGFVTIFAIIVVGGFYMAKPHLDSFVKSEIARRSINAEKSEVSIIGKVNLTNVTLPTPENVSLKIGAISGRPPIAFIPGTFTLYDVDLKYNDIHLQIPQIAIGNISLKDKDVTITSRFLQSLMRVNISSINAPDILIFTENTNKPTEKFNIKNFQLSGFKNGHIRSISIKNVVDHLEFAPAAFDSTKQIRLNAQSNKMQAYDIDVSYLYSIISGKNNPDDQSKTVIGSIALKDIMVDIFKGKEKNASFSLGELKMSDLKIKPLEETPEKLIKAYLNAKKMKDQAAQKEAQNTILRTSISAITSINVQMNKVDIDLPQLTTTLKSFQIKSSQWQQPIPESFLLSLNDLSISPKKPEQKNLNFLQYMGFEHLDISGKINFFYDEKNHALLLNGISFNIKDIGSGEISAKIVDVDKTLFSGEKEKIIAASQNLGITEIDMRYTDFGFIDKLFSYLAQNLDDGKYDLKEELYDDFYLIITQSPKILLKNHCDVENIAQSLGDFAKNPQTLKIQITAKDNKGLTADDLQVALQNNLPAVLSKVNLTIKNEPSH